MNQRLIAKKLKLSPATVSKSFRNHPDIKPETRALVLDFAAKLGYRPSMEGAIANRQAEKQTRFIGVLMFDTPGLTPGWIWPAEDSSPASVKGLRRTMLPWWCIGSAETTARSSTQRANPQQCGMDCLKVWH